ncbi:MULTISPECIES: glycosyltransferase [unclassified Agarivorans]|uniref:glycosyltransferase n=1 Tax=unclassified Agarivorans TaxID=2636026 RepID=UPI0026E360AC|nr:MULTISPECIES: glycosyltransferase [unclassified Agarivorans]MDO6686281.1 glycosyltransferase [Agarivorans sp. 3_MG-2023]MDO6716270.1 glycosyltransferase [Agarivorans sp. 2_MG-2023]
MIKLAILVPGLAQGGAERIACELASKLVTDESQVSLVTLFEGSPVFDVNPKLTIHSLRHHQQFHFKGAGVLENLLTIKSIKRYVATHKVKRLMVFTHRLACLAFIATRGTNTEIYCGEVSNPLIERHGQLWQKLIRYCYARFDQVVLQTQTIADSLNSWRLTPYQVIGNSTSIALGEADTRVLPYNQRLVFVGRLTPEKGLQDTLHALASLPRTKRWRFEIYGDGEFKLALAELIKELGLQDSVYLMGATNQVKQVLVQGGVFVMSSYREGFPVAILEAQAIGLAVISYKTQFGPEDIIQHEQTGLLVPLKDTTALAKALEHVIDAPSEQIVDWGKAASVRANTAYHPDIIYSKWRELLLSGLDS